ncbi:lysylphosphatidylglycerol synthase transmembrane domain-containing protein [Poriferisphaera sp. WC338]|uniref:lysylphosphatidylglycerol synthase transmembrane domain-containing protein n=1 Tax=Poriferisphaera sp. WC338 TaxID=3425129 RepID=UPI003D818035
MGRAKTGFKYAIRIAVTLFILLIVFHQVDFSGFMALFKKIVWIYLPAVLLLATCNRFLMAWRLRVLLSDHSGIRGYFRLVRIVFLSGFIGMIVPGGVGIDAMRLYYLKQQHGFASGASAVLADRMIGVLSMTMVSVIGGLATWQYIDNHAVLWSILGFSLLIWIAIALLLWRPSFDLIHAITGRLVAVGGGDQTRIGKIVHKLMGKLSEVHTSLLEMMRRPAVLFRVYGIAMLMLAMRVAVVILLFRCFHEQLPVGLAAAFVPMVFLLILMPISFFGIGVNEGAYVFFFGQIGIAPEVALAASLLSHLVVQSVQIGGGVACLFFGPKISIDQSTQNKISTGQDENASLATTAGMCVKSSHD